MDIERTIFLVVDSARAQALTRAWERFDDATVTEVDVYYRAATDVALIAVSLVAGDSRSRWIGRVVASGVAVIDPGRMVDGDRQAFFASYLGNYDQIGTRCAGVAAAMTALRWHTATPKPGARGTGPERALADAPAKLPPPPPAGDPSRSTMRGLGALREPEAEAAPGPLIPSLRRPDGEAARNRAATVNLRGPEVGSPPSTSTSASTSTSSSSSSHRRPSTAPEPLALTVRFVRGGHWSPARLRSLSARGAYLVTGAPPRLGDEVFVAVDFGERSALVRGSVYHVTSARDAAKTGSAGFAVRFATEPTPARRHLLELLQAARAGGVVIKPPPPRSSMRFPVRWPIALAGPTAIHVDALDLSSGGLFVAAPMLELDARCTVEMPLDNGESITMHTKVVRRVSSGAAVARGLAPGAGLAIVEMRDDHRAAWLRFLGRVERRTARTVVVGAAWSRLEALTRALTDAGYAVEPCADPGALLRLADSTAHPDAAVIDDSLLGPGVAAQWIEQLFSARQIPCITLRGEVVRARLVVDRLLAVAPG